MSVFRRRRGDLIAIGVIVALAVCAYGLPTLFGHPVLPGDDNTQNYPLRVLAGREIRDGHLPLYDPYIWSGAPLLAGWNAGAAYPLTWLFAVLPPLGAWTAGLVITWVTAGAGMHCFLRALRLRVLPAFLGALSFAFAGAMSAQVVHFGLVAGMSWVPLALLAVLRLTGGPGQPVRGAPGPDGRGDGRSWLGWVAVLGMSVALIVLAGEPRAIVDGAVIVGLYALWRVARLGRRWAPALAALAAAAAIGLALSAVQWLPGMAAIGTSQRAGSSAALFSSGSLPGQWLLLMLVPDLLGGSGTLTQPSFFTSYNLTEVTGYVGILPLVAAFAMLARVRLRPLPEWLVWHVMGVVGVVLALGGNTPLGPLLAQLPLFGSQRLQSRNILVLDLALAVLLAYWVNCVSQGGSISQWGSAPLRPPEPCPGAVRTVQAPGQVPPLRSGTRRGRLIRACARSLALAAPRGAYVRPVRWWPLHRVPGRASGPPRARDWAELALGALPALGAVVVVGWSFADGARLLEWMGVGGAHSAGYIGPLRPWLVPYAVFGAGAVALLAAGRHLPAALRAKLIAGFVVVDVVVFSALAVVEIGHVTGTSGARPAASAAPAPGSATAQAATARAAAADASPTRPVGSLGYPGRFAIYDPDQLDGNALSALGPPDHNSVTGVPSVQGYTSIVDGQYASATGSHLATGDGQNVLSPAAIANGTLDQLDTSVLLTPSQYLITTAGGPPPGPAGTGSRKIAAGGATTWYLGTTLAVSGLRVPDAAAARDAGAGTRIGLTMADGSVRWLRAHPAGASALAVSLPRPAAITAVTVQAGPRAGLAAGPPSVTAADGTAYVANGQVQDALLPPRWRFAGFDGPFAVFADRLAKGPLTLQAVGGKTLAGVSVTNVSGPATGPTKATVTSPAGVRVVRSVAAIPGWTATWHPLHGRAAALPVLTDGLVQAVDVPAGTGKLTWKYTSPRLTEGLAMTIAGAASVSLLLVLAFPDPWSAWPAARRRRGTATAPGDELPAEEFIPAKSLQG